MKQIFCVLIFLSSFVGPSYAEKKPIRSREECLDLAIQRGVTNKPPGAKKQFIHDCRHGLLR